MVFIPQKVADRLKDYIKEKGIESDQRIFPITYNPGSGFKMKKYVMSDGYSYLFCDYALLTSPIITVLEQHGPY